jgi:starch synthase
MYVVMISAESAPVAKAGGLGDFVAGIAHDMSARGHRVEIILPKYDCLRFDRIWELHKVQDLWVPHYGEWLHCDVEVGQADGLSCYFIEPHSPQAFFHRGRIYGEPDDADRFAFFSRAALEFMHKSDRHPDIIHCHDWQTGLVPVLLYEIYQQLGMTRPRVCYTLHNLGHQGWTGEHILRQVGLEPAAVMTPDRLQDNGNPAAVNLMKGGIVYSNYVTTVSPRYAWEVQYSDQGMGLQQTLQQHAAKFGGVLNGIDYEIWNPETDPHITQTYCADTLQRKARNKAALRRRLLLEDAFRPIVAVVSRLERQKGPELIRHAAHYCLANDAQFVLLGSTQDPQINDSFWELKYQLDDNPHCHLEIAYDEELSHQIFAGSDMIVIPSVYEPCGLTQMIGMRYGVVPVVRRVGGLSDTVFDANYSDQEFTRCNGYVFNDYTAEELESALERAIGLWFRFPEYFRQLRLNGMAQDHSWNRPGQRYLDIFESIRAR